MDHVIGIDLGTSNSAVAAFTGARVEVLGPEGRELLPSVVGLTPEGGLLVGEPARNQQLLYPERTVRSIKRRMGSGEKVRLGDREMTPPEVSALILRELAAWAEARLGAPVTKAVVTVPAYFSDAQRRDTREAGVLAGLEVVRILNEPTAASFAYVQPAEGRRTVLVYDLGGGTFDVSVVTIEGDVTEVLASHGNNRLGGDDFNDLIVQRLVAAFREEHGVEIEPQEHRVAYSRLWWAAEAAKRQLSSELYARVREEALLTAGGKPLHLDVELSRDEYEATIGPLVESTLDSVTRAMGDAGKSASDLDAVLLVGGSTRTPMVARMLEEAAGKPPSQEVHPDLCVALGAGVMASRLAGHEIQKVLVDVSPYSFGPSYLGERGGVPYPHCYHPIIRRNTPLPVTRTDRYFTSASFQTAVEVSIYQGDDPDALRNVPVGTFHVEGLRPVEDSNEILCRMSLDLDGILRVSAIEKSTGHAKHVTIENALRQLTDEEIAAARRRIEDLYSARADSALGAASGSPPGGRRGRWLDAASNHELDGGADVDAEAASESAASAPVAEEPVDPAWAQALLEARRLLDRSRGLLGNMHDEDKEEAVDLNDDLEQAMLAGDLATLQSTAGELKELLFYVEGR